MTSRKRNPLSVSSKAYENDAQRMDDALESSPAGLVPMNKRTRKEKHGAINRTLRAVMRAEWEAGESTATLAKRHGVTDRTIYRWIKKHEWERSVDDTPSAILQHARREIQRKVESARVEATAAVEDVLASHKGASEVLKNLLQEAMSRALAYPHNDPFRQLLIVKIASEVTKNIQAIDRKTWGLDHTKTVSQTEIYDVLTSMEDDVSVESRRIERRLEDGNE